jgi:hypothetical protein
LIVLTLGMNLCWPRGGYDYPSQGSPRPMLTRAFPLLLLLLLSHWSGGIFGMDAMTSVNVTPMGVLHYEAEYPIPYDSMEMVEFSLQDGSYQRVPGTLSPSLFSGGVMNHASNVLYYLTLGSSDQEFYAFNVATHQSHQLGPVSLGRQIIGSMTAYSHIPNTVIAAFLTSQYQNQSSNVLLATISTLTGAVHNLTDFHMVMYNDYDNVIPQSDITTNVAGGLIYFCYLAGDETGQKDSGLMSIEVDSWKVTSLIPNFSYSINNILWDEKLARLVGIVNAGAEIDSAESPGAAMVNSTLGYFDLSETPASFVPIAEMPFYFAGSCDFQPVQRIWYCTATADVGNVAGHLIQIDTGAVETVHVKYKLGGDRMVMMFGFNQQ